MPTLIHERVALARNGENQTVVCKMPSGFLVLGDVQFPPGYSLLLPDPVVGSLNDLNLEARQQFLLDMSIAGDALLEVTEALRINYEILGNTDAALHAHIFPRFAWEGEELRRGPVWFYDRSQATRFSVEEHGDFIEKLRTAVEKRLNTKIPKTCTGDIVIEPMAEKHLQECHRLNFQLGYETDFDGFVQRFETIIRKQFHLLCVAVTSNQVVGWMHIHERFLLERENMVQVAGIVVDEQMRGRGIGKMLLEYAEDWAESRGYKTLFLSSNVTRVESHKFYEKVGYSSTKQSKFFFKQLQRVKKV